ncbi:hypothetical protein BGX34_003884 [Mortierella sp. NVP85]|nr:hypothetical protein BGX34_003884 [Mortierella sp. NVP85]
MVTALREELPVASIRTSLHESAFIHLDGDIPNATDDFFEWPKCADEHDRILRISLITTHIYLQYLKYPVDALVVSIPDNEVLREPILTAKQSGITVIAVHTGLEAAKEMGILAVMSDEFEGGRSIGERFVKDGLS